MAAIADNGLHSFACLLVFAAFASMFVRLMKKNAIRIANFSQQRIPLYKFMSVKSYIIVAVMISLGISLRRLTHLPESFFAFFYTGLGSALTLCGILYLIRARTQ